MENVTYRASSWCGIPATMDFTYTCVCSDDECNLLSGEHIGGRHVVNGGTRQIIQSKVVTHLVPLMCTNSYENGSI